MAESVLGKTVRYSFGNNYLQERRKNRHYGADRRCCLELRSAGYTRLESHCVAAVTGAAGGVRAYDEQRAENLHAGKSAEGSLR